MCIVTLKVFLLVNQIKWFGWKIPKVSLNKEKSMYAKVKGLWTTKILCAVFRWWFVLIFFIFKLNELFLTNLTKLSQVLGVYNPCPFSEDGKNIENVRYGYLEVFSFNQHTNNVWSLTKQNSLGLYM